MTTRTSSQSHFARLLSLISHHRLILMHLTRLGRSAVRAQLYAQARQHDRLDRVFLPSAVLLTLAGLSLSLFGLLHQQQQFHLQQPKSSLGMKLVSFAQ